MIKAATGKPRSAYKRSSNTWGKEVPSRDEQHATKRRAILHTAAAFFSDKGFRETSLNDIAMALNVTKPTLYYYVKNKDDILFQCLNTALEDLEEKIQRLDEANISGLEKLSQFFNIFVALLDDDLGRCVIRPGLDQLSKEYRDRIKPFYRRVDNSLRSIITAGIEDGSIATCDPKITAFTMFGAMNSVIQWFDPGGRYSVTEVALQINQLLINGVKRR